MTESPMQDTEQEHYTGLTFLSLWLGMLGFGLVAMTALFHGVGALMASVLALFG